MSNIGVELSDVKARTISIRDVKVGLTAEELVAALDARGLLSAHSYPPCPSIEPRCAGL